MVLKIATIVCLIALAHSATIQKRDIPVEVKYDETTTVTGLDENLQTELPETTSEAAPEEQSTNALRNLDEKIQLSPDELSQASKHLPVVEEISLKDLGEISRSEEVTPAPTSLQSVLQQAEDVIYSGLKKLRNSFKAEKDQQVPNPEQWDDFEKSVSEYLKAEKTKLQVKQDQPPQNQNIFQNIAQGFQTVANNFVQNLVGNQNTNGNSTNLGDEQQGGQGQGPFQGFVSFFQNGVGNVVNTISNLGNQGPTTSNVVLGDTGTATTQAPSLVSNLVNNVQQFFGQIQGAVQGSGSSGTQGDTGVNSTSSSSPQRPGGQIIQSIGSAINQFIQGRPPNSSGDEGTGTTEGNVNIIQSIGNVIQNSPLNPFRPPQKPAEGEATTSNPIQAGISSAQNIGSQIQQLIPGQASSTEASKAQEQVQAEQVEPSNQTVAETSSEVAPQKAKEFDLEAVENERQEEVTNDEIAQEEVKGEEVKQQMEEQVKQEEIKEEIKQEEMREKIEEKNEEKNEVKGEEVQKQMEEQVKQEEIKEEIKQEEMKEKIEEKNEEKNEVKGEEVQKQMEEQVKQEEIKEEIKQEEMKEKIEEKNEEKKEEIMMTAE